MKHKSLWVGGVLAFFAVAVAIAGYLNLDALIPVAAMGVNWVRYLSAPAGTLETEIAAGAPPVESQAAPETGKDWLSYNKTLTSNRFSSLDEINRSTVPSLKVLCTFDTGVHTGFNTGLVEIDSHLLFASEYDTFAIDANDCHLLWRAHESYTPATPQGVNRGVAVLDGRVFRGTQDGRVIAYDLASGKRLWETVIAYASKGETVPAAPIAWNGMVFAGNAGGDIKGVKGRMYALDAATGKINWEFYLVPRSPGDPTRGPKGASPLDNSTWTTPPGSPITGGATWTSYTLDPDKGLLFVPGGNPAPDFAISARGGANLYSGSVVVLDAKTGAYRDHYKIVPRDWHDWDVSSAPALIRTAAGLDLLVEAPKDGHLYGYNLADHALVYHPAVTRVENADVPFSTDKPVHFCPGSVGGAEWNGPAYDPMTNLILVGEVEWCTTVRVKSEEKLLQTKAGQPWSAEDSVNPYNVWGKQDPFGQWAGWVYAVDGDTGQWHWRAKSNYPVQSGVTPTKGGLVFFGDMGGNFYALDAKDGHKLWSAQFGGAIGGGVIAYDAGRGERVAAATGLTEILWPTRITTAKVSILGLGDH
jgi:PQQ-dependent dehydrogenase (methanol/ethanol family)